MQRDACAAQRGRNGRRYLSGAIRGVTFLWVVGLVERRDLTVKLCHDSGAGGSGG